MVESKFPLFVQKDIIEHYRSRPLQKVQEQALITFEWECKFSWVSAEAPGPLKTRQVLSKKRFLSCQSITGTLKGVTPLVAIYYCHDCTFVAYFTLIGLRRPMKLFFIYLFMFFPYFLSSSPPLPFHCYPAPLAFFACIAS